jgi:hypothetical protein
VSGGASSGNFGMGEFGEIESSFSEEKEAKRLSSMKI